MCPTQGAEYAGGSLYGKGVSPLTTPGDAHLMIDAYNALLSLRYTGFSDLCDEGKHAISYCIGKGIIDESDLERAKDEHEELITIGIPKILRTIQQRGIEGLEEYQSCDLQEAVSRGLVPTSRLKSAKLFHEVYPSRCRKVVIRDVQYRGVDSLNETKIDLLLDGINAGIYDTAKIAAAQKNYRKTRSRVILDDIRKGDDVSKERIDFLLDSIKDGVIDPHNGG